VSLESHVFVHVFFWVNKHVNKAFTSLDSVGGQSSSTQHKLNLNQIGLIKNLHIRVNPKVTQLGGENDQFRHNRASNA
jgi:hypothetical protein